MYRIADFQKVSEEQFTKDFNNIFKGHSVYGKAANAYNDLILPKRSTPGSAGYDFYSPVDFILKSGETITIPTGIRARIDDGWVLLLAPRSGLGFKYGVRLTNTLGVIDADFFQADNEGHIMAKLTCDKNMTVKKGERFMQGVFVMHGITYEDEVVECRRTGGMGSTGK